MKKTVSLIGLLFFMATIYSQSSINFCTGVDPNGYCVFNNTKYITSPDSTRGRIYIEVQSIAASIGTAKLVMKVFSVNPAGKEKLDSTIAQNIQTDWKYAWEPYQFNSPGKYNVKIYDDAGQMICSKALEMIAFKN